MLPHNLFSHDKAAVETIGHTSGLRTKILHTEVLMLRNCSMTMWGANILHFVKEI